MCSNCSVCHCAGLHFLFHKLNSIMAGAVVWSSALLCIPADWTAGLMHRMAGVLAGDQAGFCPGSNVVPDRRGIHGGHTHTQVYTRNSSFKDAN